MDDHIRCATCGAPAQVFRHSGEAGRGASGIRSVVCSSLLCPTNLAGATDEPVTILSDAEADLAPLEDLGAEPGEPSRARAAG